MTFFDEALRHFRERHPGVDVVVEDSGSRHMAERVRTGELDLAVVGLSAAQVPAELVHHLLHEDPLVAVVPRDSPLAGRAQLGLAELAASGPLIESRKESGIRLQVDTAFARAGVHRTIAFELSTPSAVPHYVGLGLGVALMPEGPAGARDDIAVVALDDPLARHPVGLVMGPRAAAILHLRST
jgi:DNA-binding transcriptional LysR family regulator